jgi:hypothetical protein
VVVFLAEADEAVAPVLEPGLDGMGVHVSIKMRVSFTTMTDIKY